MAQHKANPHLKEGDYVYNWLTGFPGLVQDDYRNRTTRLTEAWGICHEWGSQWADELILISPERFEALKEMWRPERERFE